MLSSIMRRNPIFQNTIVALERSGSLLERVTTIFGNLLSAETNDEMQELAEKMMPLLAEHNNSISLNEKSFLHVLKAVYDRKDQLTLKRRRQYAAAKRPMTAL